MKTRVKLCYFLFFLIFNISRIAEGGDNSQMNDDLGGIQYKTDDYELDEVTENYQNKHQNYNACTYNNGKDPNIRKNIEEIIKVLIKDSLPLAMENLDAQEHDIARDIQVAANKIIIQLALHASNITRKILQSMEKPNDSLAAIDTEIQHCALIENQNQIKKIAELEDKISLLFNTTKELTDTIKVYNNQQNESMASLNNKIVTLEKITTSDSHDTRNMIAIEKNQKSFINNSELQTNQKKENVTKVTSLCDFKVPASIIPNPNIWKKWQIPEQDDLDTYMINKTGCSFLALVAGKEHVLAAVSFPGQLEWRWAMRTQDYVKMSLYWDWDLRYTFHVGYDNNTKSELYDHEHYQSPERATPELLAEDRYVPLYIRIKNGTLTAGAECEPEPWFTADCPAEKGQQIERRVWSRSIYGAKFLYDCPVSFTGQ